MALYKIDEKDNVALSGPDKIAMIDIPVGKEVVKYGFPIGIATCDIKAGEHIHTHNLTSGLCGKTNYPEYVSFKQKLDKKAGVFWGYKRKNGRAGIRNDIFIIPTVGCVNGICERLAKETGAIALTHPFGCSQLSDDHENTRKILRGLALNPNAGGVLVISLGCENNTLDSFREFLKQFDGDESRIRFMTVQNERDEIETGILLLKELRGNIQKEIREECSLSDLVVGLKCGGSDGLSGITANPLVGKMADRIISYGGSIALTEIPEMFGAESVLLNRCGDRSIYDKLRKTIDDFKDYYIAHGEPIDENPSPGNKAGGITTLAEKSLGCVQKGGSFSVTDVIKYGEAVERPGLTVLSGPGNDIVACTALAAAGANLILFTTGRGTPLGSAIPVIKISSNTELFQSKPGWIDFDAGALLEADVDKVGVEESLFELILHVAEGAKTRNETNGYYETAIWKNGVTL